VHGEPALLPGTLTWQSVNFLPSMAAAPAAKRPFGDVALKRRPTSLLRCEAATRCTLCPSTMAGRVE
jgi:hypothetical protein